MGVAGDQPDSLEPPGDQAAQERRPARPVLGAAQLQPEQLAVPVGVTGGGPSTAVLHTRPLSRTFIDSASIHTNG